MFRLVEFAFLLLTISLGLGIYLVTSGCGPDHGSQGHVFW